jgi:hypothetical protein
MVVVVFRSIFSLEALLPQVVLLENDLLAAFPLVCFKEGQCLQTMALAIRNNVILLFSDQSI